MNETYNLRFDVWDEGNPSVVDSIFGLAPKKGLRAIVAPMRVPRSGIVLVTGFSGSGKSCLLREISKQDPDAVSLSFNFAQEAQVVRQIEAPLDDVISWFSKFGLADAFVLRAYPKDLSEGQKYRLALALTLWKRPKTVIVDEFLTVLDRVTAKVVAFHFQKLCRRSGITAYCATAHSDLTAYLMPDTEVELDLDGSSRVIGRTFSKGEWETFPCGPDNKDFGQIEVKDSLWKDYQTLSHYHYSEGGDQSLHDLDLIRQIRGIWHQGKCVGATVYSKPFTSPLEAVPVIAKINKKVLISERTVIHPAYRGLGWTSRLRPCLDRPQLRDVSVIFSASAMGRFYPFKLRDGFSRVDHPENSLDQEQAKVRKAIEESPRDLPIGLVRDVFIKKNMRFIQFIAGLIDEDITVSESRALSAFFEKMFDALFPKGRHRIYEFCKPFPMAGFVKRC